MLKYSISGNLSGQLIIFINGAGMGPWMWKNQIEYFKDKKCIVFDLPGHGENKDIGYCMKIQILFLRIDQISRSLYLY